MEVLLMLTAKISAVLVLGLKGYLNRVFGALGCVLNVIFGGMSGVCDRFGLCWLPFACWLLVVVATGVGC